MLPIHEPAAGSEKIRDRDGSDPIPLSHRALRGEAREPWAVWKGGEIESAPLAAPERLAFALLFNASRPFVGQIRHLRMAPYC